MKRFLTLALTVASVGFIAVGTASAIDTYVNGNAANGIGNSRHNLGSLGEHITTTGAGATGTSEICVFCHTPHHTNTASNLKPLWNRGTQAGNFIAYSPTIGGTTVANSDIGSTSLACLSCHDGTTTFDNLVNAPGKAGTTTGNLGGDKNWSFWDPAVNGVVSDFMTSGRLNIGLNLSNDHPVSITYNASVAGLRATNTVIASINISAELATSAATFDNGNMMKNLWAVNGYIDNTATIGSLLRGGKVECSSCHDPHFNNKSWNEIDFSYSTDTALQESENNGLFLRRVGGNSGSGLCRTCHNK